MKRITCIPLAIFTLIFLASSVFALEDLTPSYPGFDTTLQNQQQTQFDPVCSSNAARLSRIEKQLDDVEFTTAAAFKQSDIPQLKEELSENVEHDLNIFLGRMVAILLVYTVFFFALIFLAKGKGYT